MRRTTCTTVAAAVALVGCATSSQDISSSYVSPLQYQGLDCDQLRLEGQRVQSRAFELGGRLDQAAQNDKALVGVGLVLFWPALFALGGTKAQEAEYGRLKGEFDALQQTAIVKKCGLTGSGGQHAGAQAVWPSTFGEPLSQAVGASQINRATYRVTDGLTKTSRSIEVGNTDLAKGTLPGTGDLQALMPPGGWVPLNAETTGGWTRSYEAKDGPPNSRAELSARVQQRQLLATATGQRLVVPVTYEGWIQRPAAYGDLIVSHKATIRIWYSPELGIPVKFESDLWGSGNHTRPSRETTELIDIN